jgi:tryptophan synthase alpha chain
LLVPDLPPEEATTLRALAQAAGLHLIFLVAPTTTPERAGLIAEASGGFVYYVSLKGVTGARAELPPDLREKVTALKQLTPKPVAVGFGVSLPEQAAAIAAFADGVIIGSALIKLIGETADRTELTRRVQAYAADMQRAITAH